MNRFKYILLTTVVLLGFSSFMLPHFVGNLNKGKFNYPMQRIKGGTFNMGDIHGEWDEITVHQVTVKSFSMGIAEVTQAQWKTIMGKNPSYDQSDENQPVTDVNWIDCMEFIRKLNEITGRKFRLPTEAEWEFAARGGNYSKDYIYSGSDNPDSVAWQSEFDSEKPHAIMQKKPNELGLYDMSGNVWEWCSDWWGMYPSAAQLNPKGPAHGDSRVLRGGSWGSSAEYCRATLRFRRAPSNRTYYYGLRLAE